MTEEQTVSSEYVYRGRAVSLRVDTVELSGGRRTTREVVEHSDSVGIVAIDAEDNVLLVRQFRKSVEESLLEIPAGGIHPGEDPTDCARRELQEETGYLPQRLERVGGFYSGPGYCSEYLHLFLATDLKPSRLHANDTESIKLVRVPIPQVPDLVAKGEINDAKSIAGLLMAIPGYQA